MARRLLAFDGVRAALGRRDEARKTMTKIIITLAMAAAAAASAPAAASAQDVHPWYAAIGGGYSGLEDTSGTIANAPIAGSTVRLENDIKSGWGARAAVGRRFGPVRIEGELGYSHNTQDHYVAIAPPTGRIPADVSLNTTRAMVNAYYDFSRSSPRPFLGVGVGVARVDVRFVAPRAPFPTEPPRTLIDNSDTNAAYQLMAGVAFDLGERTSLVTQYRWFDAGRIEARDARNEVTTRDHAGHNLDIGLNIAF